MKRLTEIVYASCCTSQLIWFVPSSTIILALFELGSIGHYTIDIEFDLKIKVAVAANGSTWEEPNYDIQQNIIGSRIYTINIEVGPCILDSMILLFPIYLPAIYMIDNEEILDFSLF